MDRGHKISVGPDGFVILVDWMGTEEDIIRSARVSTGRGFLGWDTDEKLLDYMMAHRHTSPFEQCEIKLHVRVPMDCWRQWIRHRTASVNEYSTRYSEAIDSAATTPPDAWRTQGTSNRQGSAGSVTEWPEGFEAIHEHYASPGEYLSAREAKVLHAARGVYEERLQFGVAREQARKDLPLSTYTEAYWKIDLHNLLHFLSLRLHPHAQLEIRQYAQAIARIVMDLWPRTWALFEEYVINAVTLSRTELRALVRLLGRVALADVDFGGIDQRKVASLLRKLETVSEDS